MTAILIFFAIHWYGALFFQTVFLHRYAAHQAFTMSKGWERTFFVLTWIFQGSNYLSAYAYGVMHRMHHAYADTENDPHSPMYSNGIFDMMLKTAKFYSAIRERRIAVDPKFTANVPDWKSFDDFASSRVSRVAWGTLYTLFYIYFAPSWGWFLLLPVHYLLSPIHGAIINWFAHKIGYTTFKVNDTSKNLMPVDFLMMGEGFHNNHHTYGNRANFAFKWFEIDPSYQIMKVLNVLNVIQLPKEKGRTKVFMEKRKMAS
ncbi:MULTISPECIES: acyl-CoA desaturase [unclassified Siphonobacter]|uniref:acyl-CoA desaturase n=1 Tax=unclassified Siphonobacter TaxID=2635712 RepID=UPI000CB52BB1|nr:MULTISPECIES: acyl-CoA desaturase [unclassified Siphonobacter]MDQ1090133.1 stearoyl-CoA desaturase (delta-9 desaturase) [Siphonobacter sp. SORGH_AS_1065]MDR6197868.1 stearoyl-CoA desaturase (delta-9 desaturase) [Siphonobacter sp. SORGH_AS_0500]PKK37225.1 acyl-CoA desaturase [Siphonobacter sp. SORGH_AS_0500]